jgi:hypothetical protein
MPQHFNNLKGWKMTTLISITEFCKEHNLSRKNFYAHEKRGAIGPDCFRAMPGSSRRKVVKEKAEKALAENVRVNAGGQATKRKYGQQEMTICGAGAMAELHRTLSATCGLGFDPDALDQDFSEKDLQSSIDESVNQIFAALADVAAGKDPVRKAVAAVLLTLSAVHPGGFSYNEARINAIVAGICKCKPKKTKGSKNA